jgi:hypothetical protein
MPDPTVFSPHVAAYPPAGFIAPCLPIKTTKLPSGRGPHRNALQQFRLGAINKHQNAWCLDCWNFAHSDRVLSLAGGIELGGQLAAERMPDVEISLQQILPQDAQWISHMSIGC